MITIYGLVNIETNETYIGCTAGKLSKRMREHRCLLRHGKHSSQKLQSDWNKHGESHFRLNVLDTLKKDSSVIEKRELELKWMKKYASESLLYNDNMCSFRPPIGAPAMAAKKRVENGYSPSVETRLKSRLAQLGKPKNHGAKISATKKAKNRL